MTIKVLGISGSPIKNGNTNRVVKAILSATGLETEFIQLSTINVKPCLACKRCVNDNICKVDDDFPRLSEKLQQAEAIILGCYIPYAQIDAFTKSFLERLWSLRHLNNVLANKLCATVITGLNPESLAAVNRSVAAELRDYESMELLGQITIAGNIPCATCGVGDECKKSGLRARGMKVADHPYCRAEDQENVWGEALRIGNIIREYLS